MPIPRSFVLSEDGGNGLAFSQAHGRLNGFAQDAVLGRATRLSCVAETQRFRRSISF